MNPISPQARLDVFPHVSRWLGLIGLVYEMGVLQVVYHQQPNTTALLILAYMAGFKEVLNLVSPGSTKPKEPPSEPVSSTPMTSGPSVEKKP